MITPEEIVGEEWASWYRLSPQERWHESEKLWQVYFYLGGLLDAQPDTQSLRKELKRYARIYHATHSLLGTRREQLFSETH